MSDFREFLNPEQIKDSITKSKAYEDEGVQDTRALLIFSTQTQQTWLVASTRRLYCILDDRRRPTAGIQWTMSLPEARKGPIESREYRGRTGFLDIGRRRDWLYSKNLFSQNGVVRAVESLLSRF
jgi:hypothetical protein